MSGDTVRALLLAVALAVASLGGVGVVGAAEATDTAAAQPDAAITAASALPGSVEPGATVSAQRVSVRLRNLSADGRPDTLSLTFPDALAGNLTVRGAGASGNVTVGTPTLVDGPDDDGNRDTVELHTNATGGGTVDVTVDVTLRVTYPERNATYRVDAVLLDSRSGVSTADGVATIVVGTGAERTNDRRRKNDTTPTAQDVDVTISDPEDVQKAKVKVKSKVKNATVAVLPRSVCSAGVKRPPFVYDQDVDVYVNNATGDIGKLKVKVKSKVKKLDFADAPRVRVNGTNVSALCRRAPTSADGSRNVSVDGLFGWGTSATAAVTGAASPGTPAGSPAVGFGAGLLGGGTSVLAAVAFRLLG